MSSADQWLESAIRAAGEALRAAQDDRVRKHTANGVTLLNWSLHLQQQLDRGEEPGPEKPRLDHPAPPLTHRRD